MAFYEKAPVRIHYQEAGSGFPLFVIPGGGQNSTIGFMSDRAPFNAIEEFKDEYRCITADLRNAPSGQSSGPLEIDRPWDSYADDHLALMDHLGIRRFMVIGYCIGGPFIWKLLQRAPERIVAAVVSQPVGFRKESRWDTPELIGGASTMMGTGVHSVDLLRFVLGAEVDEITAVTDGQTLERPLEQLACLALRFDNGTLGQVVASRLLPDSRNDFRVYGITGLIAGTHSMWEARTGHFQTTSDTVNETADYPEALLPNYVAEIEDFQRAAATGGQPAATGLDGLRVVEVTLAMIESARTHRSVTIERVEP
jgi:pimeloyl-ACP methyl ester carboxylesterase